MLSIPAAIGLFGWPLVAIALFKTQKLNRAILWTVIGAQMLLPTGAFLKISFVPQFDKYTIPNLCILLGCLFVEQRRLQFVRRLGVTEWLVIAYFVSPIITAELNGDPVAVGGIVIPGVGLYDALSAAENAFAFVLPFFVGRQFLRSANSAKEILSVLALAGVIYSLPMLFEIRMSPNLQNWVYHVAPPGGFEMTVRSGGYRPMVFMGHGLVASFFMMTTTVAAAALWRLRERSLLLPWGGWTAYLSGVLVLCKSFGALLYGIMLVPAVRWISPRLQMRLAVLLVSIALMYPALRAFDLFPAQTLLQTISSVSSERSASLKTRFDNEDKLAARWAERPVFGWGRYGRNRVYNEENGRDESITDGLWIITLGSFGLIGFIAQFGLLSLAVFRAASSFKMVKSNTDAICMAAIALILAANIVELIPNSGLLPWTWLLCGALLGRAEALRSESSERKRRGAGQVSPVASSRPRPAIGFTMNPKA
jgi:hypothetical protein